MVTVYRAPMRARSIQLTAGKGADEAIERGIVGIGEPLARVPRTLDEAATELGLSHGDKAGRLLRAFASVPEGTFVWTRTSDGRFRLGRISGPWRYESSRTGIVHTRPADWLERPFRPDDVPAAVAAAFARGGRNFQRIRSERAEERTRSLWQLLR
jgi:hypothetical protein